MSAVVEVTEYTDPGCPWSWGSEPRIAWVRDRYGAVADWRRVFGVQMDGPAGQDAEEAPEAMRERWLAMAAHTGAPITDELQRAHASTRPAALAAKAAEAQGPEIADAVLRRLREAFFVDGTPPDTTSRIAEALRDVPGLDLDALLAEMHSDTLVAALQRDFEETRAPRDEVIDLIAAGPHPGAAKQDGPHLRYGFPTLIIRGPAGERIVPGWRTPEEYREAFEAVAPQLRELATSPTQASSWPAEGRALDPATHS